MISPDFGGIVPDQYLSNRLKDKDYVDPRNSLVFWARPPDEVLSLAMRIQAIIKEVMPCKIPIIQYAGRGANEGWSNVAHAAGGHAYHRPRSGSLRYHGGSHGARQQISTYH